MELEELDMSSLVAKDDDPIPHGAEADKLLDSLFKDDDTKLFNKPPSRSNSERAPSPMSMALSGTSNKEDEQPKIKKSSSVGGVSSIWDIGGMFGKNTTGDDHTDIAEATRHAAESVNNSTWDGFKPINHTNIESNASREFRPPQTEQEKMKEKFVILRKLEQLEESGATLTKKYNMNSNLDEMRVEYDNLIMEKHRLNGIKFQRNILTTTFQGIEYLNSTLNPFDIDLDGLSDHVNDEIESYDDIFNELYEKYGGQGNFPPEIRLAFSIVSSIIMVNMANRSIKNIPGMDMFFRENPQAAKMLMRQAFTGMKGMGNFMNEFGGGGDGDDNYKPKPSRRKQPQSYAPAYEDDDFDDPYNIPMNIHEKQRQPPKPKPNRNAGPSMSRMAERAQTRREQQNKPPPRTEMKGPSTHNVPINQTINKMPNPISSLKVSNPMEEMFDEPPPPQQMKNINVNDVNMTDALDISDIMSDTNSVTSTGSRLRSKRKNKSKPQNVFNIGV